MKKRLLSLLLVAALVLMFLPAPGHAAGVGSGVKALYAGKYHTLLLTESGELWAWGDNRYGQLGVGDTRSRTAPVKVMEGVTAAAAGGWTSYALTGSGELWAWGSGEQGQLGVDTGGAPQLTPIKAMTNVTCIAAALNRAYAVSGGKLWAWGNASCTYPDGERLSVVPRSVAEGVDRVAAGGSTTLLFRGDVLTGWGGALAGSISESKQLSEVPVASGVTGAAANSKTVCYLKGGSLYGFSGGKSQLIRTNVTAVSAGESHCAMIDGAGGLWTWGTNASGELGTGDANSRTAPVKVLSGVTCTAAGSGFTCAAKQNGGVWGWGDNTYGQIAGGENIYSYNFPHLAVPGLYDLPQTADSSYHILINGVLIHPDVAPTVRNGRILAPLRAVFEKFGTVDWDGATKTVSATIGGTEVSLRIGESQATVNGVKVALDAPAIIVSGRTLVPLRFISETAGAVVTYEASERTADIYLAKQSLQLNDGLRSEYRSANVRIDVKLKDGSTGTASGVILHTGGLILTNRHVVENAASLTVTTAQGVKCSEWELFYTDNVLDCALLKVPMPLPGAAKLGESSALRLGDAVAICGVAPDGEIAVRSTTVAQFRYAYGGSFLCAAEPVPGNSGGGVYASSGLVGVVWGGAGGKTVAVPVASVAEQIAKALKHYGLD